MIIIEKEEVNANIKERESIRYLTMTIYRGQAHNYYYNYGSREYIYTLLVHERRIATTQHWILKQTSHSVATGRI